jgi:hypothetical protein
VTTFALIGSWRERMFLKVALSWAQSNAERWWCVRRAAWTCRPLRSWTCLREVSVDFVLTATPRAVTPRFNAEVVDRDLPVLAETPPAPDLASLRALWCRQ